MEDWVAKLTVVIVFLILGVGVLVVAVALTVKRFQEFGLELPELGDLWTLPFTIMVILEWRLGLYFVALSFMALAILAAFAYF